MPGKQARVLCPVCQEPIPPDETECENCGAFVIDEAVVRLSRAFGLDREKALKLFEAGFRHPTQLRDRDPNRVLEKGELGLLFICTNCGGFVAGSDSRCPRCAAEFESEPEQPAPEEDILDLVLCTVCGADNDPAFVECEICGAPLREPMPPSPASSVTAAPAKEAPASEKALQKVDDFLKDLESPAPEPIRPLKESPAAPAEPRAPKPAAAPKPSPAPRPLPPPPKPTAPVRPVPKPKPEAVESPKAAPRPEPTAPPEVLSRPSGAPSPKAAPASLPTRRLRATPSESPRRKRDRLSALRISPEMAGGLVLASAVGLVLAGLLGQGYLGLGIAAFLLLIDALVLFPLRNTDSIRISGLDGVLLASGAALGLSVSASSSGSPETLSEIVLALAGAIPFAWASRRLLAGSQRILLAIATSLPLMGYAIGTAADPRFAGTLPWTLGILVTVPWPGALAAAEIRRRRSTSVLRRELVRAERQIAQKNYEHSLREYERAIAVTRAGVPGAEVPWYGKGATLVLLGRYEEALRAIDTALDINPHNEVAWVNKGNALTKMGRLVDALRCFNASIKVNPQYEVAWNNKGNALARLGKYEEALSCYERALGLDPSYRGAWVNKGFVLAKLGRFDEAATCADHALRLDVGRRAEPA